MGKITDLLRSMHPFVSTSLPALQDASWPPLWLFIPKHTFLFSGEGPTSRRGVRGYSMQHVPPPHQRPQTVLSRLPLASFKARGTRLWKQTSRALCSVRLGLRLNCIVEGTRRRAALTSIKSANF